MVAFTRIGTNQQVSHFNDINELQVPIEQLTDRYFYAPLFGVPYDGVTDATAAIHALRDVAGADAEIHFPAGVYLVSGLIANVENQTWILDRLASFALIDGTNNTSVIQVTADGVHIVGPGVIDANGANQTGTSNGVLVTGDDCILADFIVLNAKTYGVRSANCHRPKMHRVRVLDSGNTGLFAEAAATATEDVEDIEILACSVDRSSLGIGVAGAGIVIHGEGATYRAVGATVGNCTVRMPDNPTSSGAICIEVYGLAPGSAISTNHTFGGSMGVSADRSNHTTIANNPIFGPKSYGIELASSKQCSIVSNPIDGNGLTAVGIAINNASNGHNEVVANPISNLGGGSAQRGVKANASPFTAVIGNSIEMSAAGYAIELIASDDCTISDNPMDGASVALKAIMINTSSRVGGGGNGLKNFTEHGYCLFATTAVTIDNIGFAGGVITNCNVPAGSQLSGGAVLGANVRFTGIAGMTQNGKAMEIIDMLNNIKRIWGTGSPEGVVSASDGSYYVRTDGGIGTTFYVKGLGTSTTGWHPVVTNLVSADKGDAAATLTVGTNEQTNVWNTALGADRAVTLSTTGAHNGARFRVVRTAAATGAFNLNVGTGPLKALGIGEWCDVEYDGSAWMLTAYGAL